MTLATLLAALLALPVFHEDTQAYEKPAQLTGIAAAVLSVARNKDEAAFLIAWGEHETRYSLRIHRGLCTRWECDRGKARGPWQNWRVGMSDEKWARLEGIENTRAQAAEAMKRARSAMRTCPADRIRGAFRVLGGMGCTRALRGEDARMETFQRVRAKL